MVIPRTRALRLLLEKEAYAPGETVRGRVELDWPKSRPVRGVRITLRGAEETSITVRKGSGKDARSVTYREEDVLIGEQLTLWGGNGVGLRRALADVLSAVTGGPDYPLLRAGRHSYDFDFRLPSRALPSFTGTCAKIRYRLTAEVDIPLAGNLVFEGDVPVAPLGAPRIAPLKVHSASKAGGILGALRAHLGMNLDLEGCPLAPREKLQGRLLLRNLSRKKIRGITFTLAAVEVARAGGYTRETTHLCATGFLPAPDPSAPVQDATFGIRLKEFAVPYAGRYSEVNLFLLAEVDVALGLDPVFRVPLEIE
ncbi:MAG TPA: hypothetical protein VJB14_00715 [Planctomycetota bacterium]|nr:hypothetical protein [Planctomycetota bacterium]